MMNYTISNHSSRSQYKGEMLSDDDWCHVRMVDTASMYMYLFGGSKYPAFSLASVAYNMHEDPTIFNKSGGIRFSLSASNTYHPTKCKYIMFGVLDKDSRIFEITSFLNCYVSRS